MKTIIFDQKSKRTILRIFGKDIDAEGFIIESKTGERVLTPDGKEVTIKDFAGIRNGSEVFITKDMPSLIKYATDLGK